LLKVTAIEKVYGQKEVLSDCSFEMHRGEIIGLIGENGAGKSTLIQLLATVQKPTSGEIQLDELNYGSERKKVRKLIGYVPQEISIWEEFSVEENMLFFERLSWIRRTPEECRQLCLDMQLTQWKEKAHTLSGGMKRKLNLAISLLHNPVLLLLDEPTVGIDLKSKTEIGQYLHRLAKKEGKMILYTSHDMDEITSLCDKVYSVGSDPFYKEFLHHKGIEVFAL
jgi:ABC-2 type transport system ATP-binding protein